QPLRHALLDHRRLHSLPTRRSSDLNDIKVAFFNTFAVFDRTLFCVGDLVDALAFIDHRGDILFDDRDVFRNFFYGGDGRAVVDTQPLQPIRVLDEFALIGDGCGDNVVYRDVADDTRLDLNAIDVAFILDLQAGEHLFLGVDAVPFNQRQRLFRSVALNGKWHGCDV